LTVNLRGLWDFKLAEMYSNRFSTVDEKVVAGISKEGWEDITVPGAWEGQGFKNYDGSAWYRKQFTIPKEMAGEDLVLMLGKIDDSDKTFLNGKLIGTSFEKYDKIRIYHIPMNVFKPGEINTLIVFVEDPRGVGGIYEGPVGIMKQSEFTRYIRWK
jgi:beta-galactosidase/beta-glucuronidase